MSTRTRIAAKPRIQAHKALGRRLENSRFQIHRSDWAGVVAGARTMYRTYGRLMERGFVDNEPQPGIVYSYREGWTAADGLAGLDTALVVLTDRWNEPLGAISQADIEEEGFSSLAEYRAYFASRSPAGFMPLSLVVVYRFRLMEPDDEQWIKDKMFEHLYGDFRQS